MITWRGLSSSLDTIYNVDANSSVGGRENELLFINIEIQSKEIEMRLCEGTVNVIFRRLIMYPGYFDVVPQLLDMNCSSDFLWLKLGSK